MNKTIYLYIGGGIVAIIVIGYALDKIFGKSANTKEAEALGTDVSMGNTITNNVAQGDSAFAVAIRKKFGKKPTNAQLKSLLPNIGAMPKLAQQIDDAHNYFSQNDSAKIIGAFKQMRSQYEVNFFASMYSVQRKTDMYGKLDQLMHDSDMAKLREMINLKPII